MRTRRQAAAWLALAAVPVAIALSAGSAHAATDTWTGTTDSSWLTPTNWTGGNAPPQAGDTIVFSGTTALSSDDNLGDGFSLAGIQFTTGAGAFVLSSHAGANDQALALTGPLLVNTGTSTAETINFAINGTSASSLSMGSDKSGGNSVVLGASDTFGLMSVGTNSTTPDSLNIGATTLSVNGAVAIGSAPIAGTSTISTTILSVTGSGTWNVNSATNTNFSVGVGANTNNNGNVEATLDMTGLAHFSFTTGTGNFGVGYKVTRPAAVAKLANTSNSITSALIGVGDSSQNGNGTDNNNNQNLANILDLGAGTNDFKTNTLIIGQTKTAGVVQYLTPTGSVTIKGEAGGTSTTNITIANATGGTAPGLSSSLLLANNNATSATIQAGTVIVGNSNGITGGTSTGLLTFDTGTFNATSLSLGTVSGGAFTALGGASGTLTLGTSSASTGVLTVTGNFTLAGDTNTTANGGTATGKFIINGGTANLNSNVAITTLGTSVNSNTLATLTLAGGTLNMNGFAICNPLAGGAFGTVTVNLPDTGQTATIANLGGNGIYATAGTGATSSGVVMGGAGMLILAGNNTYAGPTTVSSGTLQIGSGNLGGSIPAASTFTNSSIVTFAGNVPITISNNITGSGVVNQNGSGATTLSGTNTYGGNTTINAGTLAVTGSISGNVSISPTNTGGTLAGTGSVGNVTMSAAGAIHPGAGGADLNVGTLSLSSLNVTGGDMRFDIGGANSDAIVDSGSATFTGGTISIALDSAPTLSSYTVLTASGGLSGSPILSTTSIGRTTFALVTVGNSLKINISGGPATLTWNHVGGSGDGVTWNNTGNNQNWSKAGVADTFFDADNVTFNDTNGGHSAVSITTQVQPGSVTFANSSASYVFSGAGGIAGTTGLTMNGAGSVTLQTVNTYAGNTNVNAGMLILSGGGSIASGNFNVAGGAVNVNGGGSLGSANINVNSGSLSIAPGGALTNLSPIVTVAGGASMSVAAGATIPTSLSVVDNGTVTLNGATTLGTLSGSGVVTLNGANLTIASGGTVGNVLQDGGSAGSLTVNAGSPLILTGANTYSGATAINSGATLQIGNGGATGGLAATSAITNAGTLVYNLAAPSAVTIANAIANTGTLNFNSAGDLNVTGAITGSGTLRQTGAGTTSLSGDISGFTGGITLGGGTLVFNYAAPTTVSNAIGVVAGATSAVRNVGKLTMSGVESVGSTAGAITYNVTPIAGNMPSGVPADVEITGSINRTSGSDGVGIIKTGTGTLAISGATDNASLGATVNGGTLLLNKTSATTIHAIGGGGLVINNGGTVKITGTGGEQIYNAAGTTTIADGGTFDLNGQSQGLNNMTLGNATGAGLLTTSVPGLAVVAKIGTAVGTANDAGASAAATIGRLSLGGDSNISAASGASIELQNNGLSATGGNHTLSDIGPGTVLLTGLADNSAVNVAVTSGTLVLAKPSVAGTATGSVHSASSVTGVSAGATLQLAGSGGDQLFDGFAVASGTQPDYGVLNMNGTFDMNGQSEGLDKLTGTGNVINSQSGMPVTLTLGTNNGLGAATPEFDGVISGNIALIKADATTPPATEVPLILGGANTYTGNTNVSAGVLTIAAGGSIASANVVVAASANPGTLPPAVLNVNGSLASNANVTANGPVNFGGTTGATANTQALSSLAIGSGVTITITPSVGPLHPTILAPAATTYTDASSLIDITNNAFISNGSAASALVQLQTGQIFSSVAPDLIHAIGYINLSGGRFEVRYTLKGDSNLDGVVNVGDLGALATSYGITGGMSWGNGDFNRDGNVDVGDLGALATNYGSQLASGPSAESAALVASPLMLTAAPSAIAAVPEPASLGVLAISAIGILANRRRR